MNLKHKVRINVSGKNGTKEMVLSGGETKIRSGFLDRLLGDNNCVLILRLGPSVADVEVTEISEGGDEDATLQPRSAFSFFLPQMDAMHTVCKA